MDFLGLCIWTGCGKVIMSGFDKLRKAIKSSGKHLIVATAISTDSALLTADVVFEGEQITREKIPLRIFSDESGLGVAFIPKLQSEVLIGFVNGAEDRPQVLKVQEWDKLIIRKETPGLEIIIDSDNKVDFIKESGFQFTIDSDDKVTIGNADRVEHKIAWGDVWLQKFNAHTHPTPTGPSGPPFEQLIDTDVNSQIFTVE